MNVVVRRAEVEGRIVDVSVAGGAITAIGPGLPADGEVIDARGAALTPGLHDHHMHLLALAAARGSFSAGPPRVRDADALRIALADADRAAPPGAWLRGVGFHESVVGGLDRWWLDAVAPHRPVRIQHRSGARWILSSAALAQVDVERMPLDGVERDAAGVPTGRLTGLDAVLRDRWPTTEIAPALAAASAQLLRFGVTGLTDATPYARIGDFEPMVVGLRDGSIRQRLTVMGAPGLAPGEIAALGLRVGPAKIVVGDHDLPSFDELCAAIALARTHGRPVAVHCVTRLALVLTMAALDEVGVLVGDRIEHGAVVDPDAVAHLAVRGLTVVTQPNFIAERGDEYLADVEADDVAHLYPCGRLLDAGVEVGGSTDAPFGNPDPWLAMAAAIHRRTASGQVLGSGERIAGRRALDLFLGAPETPGGPVRRVEVGAAADLVLLDGSLAEAAAEPLAARVRATLIGGEVVFGG